MKKLIKKILKEDDWDWVRDINHEIVLKPNTLYYFDPMLTAEEAIVFADNIIIVFLLFLLFILTANLGMHLV
jgi:hypothetical protein